MILHPYNFLYKDKLCIVACDGFQHKEEIYKMEFPILDDSYPNYQVLKNKKGYILNTGDFSSIQE